MSSDREHILDTAVLLYFLLVKRVQLLGSLIGYPLQVPFAVYDPEDRDQQSHVRNPEFLSEMRQAERHYAKLASLGRNAESWQRVRFVDSLYDDDRLISVSMSPAELILSALLQSPEASGDRLPLPLGPGEAACVAICIERGWTIVTDDSDAFKVLDMRRPGSNYRYERIRKLLIRAAHEGLITEGEANRIHSEMRSHGFWDSGKPFP